MKHIFSRTSFYLLGGLALLMLWQSCKKDRYWDIDSLTSITAPTNLQPKNADIIHLDPSSNAVTVLSWKASQTGDNTMIFYTVLFDKEGGNFTHPIDSVTTPQMGIDTTLNLSDKQLNVLAEKAGIEELSEGTVLWKIVASNGVVFVDSDQEGELKIKRPAGFATAPTHLMIYGDAAESQDKQNALPFKEIHSGVFEIYTALQKGQYMLTDGDINFKVDGDKIQKGESSVSLTDSKKVYRIQVDFNTSKVDFTEIKSMGLWIAANGSVTKELPYVGNGVWKIEHTPIVFSQQSWGKDERYKFRATEQLMDGSEQFVFWSSSKKDNQRPGSSSGSYYYLAGHNDSQWDYTFKFKQESIDAAIAVQLQAIGTYTHVVTYN